MKITQAKIDAVDGFRPTEIGPLSGGLNVVYSPRETGKTTLAALIAETLFGVRDDGVWRESAGQFREPFGAVEVASELGRYRLRRQQTPEGRDRFTIAALDGHQVNSETISKLLGSASPEVIAQVFFAANDNRVASRALLSDPVAREYQRLGGGQQRHVSTETTGRQREDLLHRRDEVAREIELRLADRRRVSGELEVQLTTIDGELAKLEERRAQVTKSLQGVESELASVESSLRYRAIAEEAERANDQRESAEWGPKLDELEQQIEQWRATLSELEQRESEVRSELSVIHPDDAEPSLPLADQRAGLAVAQRLVEDLESEVARLARSAASDLCVCQDAHPRMNPLVDTLDRQLNRLSELVEQQDMALHVQSLRAEAAHLNRSQDDLREQLDHLLSRRQSLWRTTRSRRTGPAEELAADEELLASGASRRVSLDNRRAELKRELELIGSKQRELESEREATIHRRSELLSEASLEALQSELADLTARLRTAGTQRETHSTSVAPWRASEWFAKLVDGRFASLRLIQGGRSYAVIEPSGAEHSAESLSPSEQRLAGMSLRLALVAGFTQQGVQLPLVLDEPFAGLDSRQAAILANVLDDFSRLGHQLLVFTASGDAAQRFKSLGVPLLPLEAIVAAQPVAAKVTRRFEVEAEPAPPAPVQLNMAKPLARRVETQREYLLDPEDAIERFPVPIADRTAVFARSRIRTVGDLLSADPSAVAEELDRDDVSAELVALWQTHLAFVCFVPGMSFEDASMLTNIGVLSPAELDELNEDELDRRMAKFLRSERGERYSRSGYRWSRERGGDWRRRGERGMRRWRDSDHWRGWERHRGERRQWIDRSSSSRSSSSSDRNRTLRLRSSESERGERSSRTSSRSSSRRSSERSQRSSRSAKAETKQDWRFYLEIESPVVDAPSIGPKTASRLNKVGIQTVNDLIEADAEALAAELENKRITAETIVAWQHQAQLVCRIPQIRGHDAQILVACGFTQPEEVASMKPAELLEFVEPFSESSEGQRILRDGKAPDLAEVSDWINWSRHCRVLGAA